MSTEAGLWALVVLLAVLVVILLALLLRAHQSNEAAAKSQPHPRPVTEAAQSRAAPETAIPDSNGANAANANAGISDAALRRRNAGTTGAEAALPQSAAPSAGPRSPSRLQPPSPRQEVSSHEPDATEDSANRYQASLERGNSNVAWGFAWNVAALAMKRLIVAGVDPASPAGTWNTKRQEDGSLPMQRGDEVVAVNQVTTYSEMRKELAIPALQVNLRLVVEAASTESSPNREALRRRREGASSKASSASGIGSNESSPFHIKSPRAEDPRIEESKPRSPQMPMGNDHVKVRNTFIEVSEEAPQEEAEQDPANSVRFTQSDPTPVIEAMRNTATTACTMETSVASLLSQSEVQDTPELVPDTPASGVSGSSPGRRKPTPLSEDSEISETPAPLPSSSPREDSTSWIPETPEAFGFGGHPLLLEQLLPEESLQVPSPQWPPPPGGPPSPALTFQAPLLTTPPPALATPPVLQYSPQIAGQTHLGAAPPEEAFERLPSDVGHSVRWTSQTLPLPPGALPPGPVQGASPISEASPSDSPAPHAEATPRDSEESETEVTSPESRRKPTRRGGRRARHRKMAALARQQAAEAEAEEVDAAPGGAVDCRAPSPNLASDRPFSPVAPSVSSTSSPCRGGFTVCAEADGAQLIGRMVLIQNLIRSPEFNGQWGHVESYDPLMQRYLVSVVLPTQLPGEAPLYAKLRRDNLIVPRPEFQGIPSTKPAVLIPSGEAVSNRSCQVHWPAEPAFIQEHVMQRFQPAMVQAGSPGPAADFEDSVGASLMTPMGCRIQPGATLEDSGSPPTTSFQDSCPSKPSMTGEPDVLSPEVRQMWMNQGTAADFEDSVVGQLFDSPKAASKGGSSPSSRLKHFGGFGYAEGSAADFEDSIGGTFGGTGGWSELLRKEEPAAGGNTGSSWQPSLRPRNEA